jgi:hypothetical protein
MPSIMGNDSEPAVTEHTEHTQRLSHEFTGRKIIGMSRTPFRVPAGNSVPTPLKADAFSRP